MNIFLCESDDAYRARVMLDLKESVLNQGIRCPLVADAAGEDALKRYIEQNTEPTLYFLNIDLGGELNGLELARKIREREPFSPIVLITAFAGQANLTFKYQLRVLDYIVKGARDQKSRVDECVRTAWAMTATDARKKLMLTSKREVRLIALSDIFFLESGVSVHKVNIYHRGGCYEGRGTLKELFTRLDGNFMYCHKSFIINKANICFIDRKERRITFENGLSCWYSKDSAAEVLSCGR